MAIPAGGNVYLSASHCGPSADGYHGGYVDRLDRVANSVRASRLRDSWRFAISGKHVLAPANILWPERRSQIVANRSGLGLGVGLGVAGDADVGGGISRFDAVDHGIADAERGRWAVPIASRVRGGVAYDDGTMEEFWGPTIRDCFELYCGFVPVVALLAIFFRLRWLFLRRHGWECLSSFGRIAFCFFGIGGSSGGRSGGFLCSIWSLDSLGHKPCRNGPCDEIRRSRSLWQPAPLT